MYTSRPRNAERGADERVGREIFTQSFDPDLIAGWGKRTYNWEMGVSVQHEVLPRLGVTLGYFRRWYGNFYTANNRLTTTAQTRVQIGVDVYNLLNTDVVTQYNNGYTAPTAARGSIWLTPNAIQPARYARLNLQVDF